MKTYQFLPQILLRTPAFSFKDYSALKLKTILKNNYFQKALLIASSSLYHQLEKTGFDYEQLSHREQQSVRKYFNRLCFRPTPFGAFSTFSVVNWGPELYIEVKKQRIHLTKSFAEAIIAGQILKHSMGREQLQYKVNQTLYESADDLRYLAAFPNEENTAFEFSIKSISNMPVLKKLKTFCAPERSYNELINFLTGEQIERAEAGQLIDELIGIQFLTDNLMPNITGQDYLEKIAPKQFKSLILPVSNSQINFNNSNRLAENIPDANKVYVNTEGLSGGSLNPEHQETLLKALNCLFSFSSRPASAGNLADFIAAYQKKFEGRALPLLYVLDPETGIGYRDLADHLEGKELIQEINWPSKSSPKLITQWSAAHSLLLKKWHQAGPVISLMKRICPRSVRQWLVYPGRPPFRSFLE